MTPADQQSAPILIKWQIVGIIVAAYLTLAGLTSLLTSSPSASSDLDETMTFTMQHQHQQRQRQAAGITPATLQARRHAAAVVELAKAAWNASASDALRGDPARPLSGTTATASGAFSASVSGTALTAHDGIDTLILLGLFKEAEVALKWILHGAALPNGLLVSDAVARFVGGMLGAFSLTGDQRFLDRALYHASSALDSSSRNNNNNNNNNKNQQQQFSRFVQTPGFGGRDDSNSNNNAETCVVSEILSLALPLSFLSTVTTDRSYAAQGTAFQQQQQNRKGLLPCFVDCSLKKSSSPFSGSITLGPLGIRQLDSYLKQWILRGKPAANVDEFDLVRRYEAAVAGLFTALARYTTKTHFAFVGSASVVDFDPAMTTAEMCSIPGTLALGLIHGVHSGADPEKAREVEAFASDLLTTCVSIAARHGFVMPHAVRFVSSSHSKTKNSVMPLEEDDKRGSLRSGLAESLFYMYRYTGDDGLRDIGAALVAAIEKHSPTGAPLRDVTDAGKGSADEFVADYLPQTLKFLFLLFSDPASVVSLDEFVFDHGGHPYRIGGVPATQKL